MYRISVSKGIVLALGLLLSSSAYAEDFKVPLIQRDKSIIEITVENPDPGTKWLLCAETQLSVFTSTGSQMQWFLVCILDKKGVAVQERVPIPAPDEKVEK